MCLGTAAAVAGKAGCVQLVKTAANCCSPRKKPDFSRCFGGRGELWGQILGNGREYRCLMTGRYGPFAENLGHVLKVVEGHMVTGYADGGDAPEKQLELVPGAAGEAEKFLKNECVERS